MIFDTTCPHCHKGVLQRRNPVPTVDIIIFDPRRGVVLVQRKNTPLGWALPGGFVDYGEMVEQAAVREALEETSLQVQLVALLGVYSDPQRDPRLHTMSTVFVAQAPEGTEPYGADDAAEAVFFPLDALPQPLVFDHTRIMNDFVVWLASSSPSVISGSYSPLFRAKQG